MRFERIHLFQFDEALPGMVLPSEDRVRLATTEDVKRLAKDPVFDMADYTDAQIDQLYSEGHRCALNLADGKIVGYSWLRWDRIDIPALGLGFQCRPNEGYTYKGLTHPNFRGRGLASDRFLLWRSYLRKSGRTAVLAYFAIDNKATLTRVRKLKMKKLGTATLMQIGPFRKLFLSRGFRERERFKL